MAIKFGRQQANVGDLLFYCGQRLSPKSEHVGVARSHSLGVLGCAAEENRQVRVLPGAHLAVSLPKVIELALVVEWLLLGPDPPQNVQVFTGTAVALFVVQPVAFPLLFHVAAAGDHMQGNSTGS